MQVAQNATSVRIPIEALDSANQPATGLTHASAITIDYRRPADASWQGITLVAGSTTYTSGGFRSLGDHVYEVCIPDAAIVADESSSIRYTYDSETRYDVIDARLVDEATISSADLNTLADLIATTLSQIRLTVQQQLTLTSGVDLTVIRGDDYTRSDAKVVIALDTSNMADPNIDLSPYKLVICGQNGASLVAVRMPIIGSPGSHTAEFDPPSSETEQWAEGSYDLLYRIEWAADEFTTLVETGILNVQPFDIEPSDIVDI